MNRFTYAAEKGGNGNILFCFNLIVEAATFGGNIDRWQLQSGNRSLRERLVSNAVVGACLDMSTYVVERSDKLVLYFGLVAGVAASDVVLIGGRFGPEEACPVILV